MPLLTYETMINLGVVVVGPGALKPSDSDRIIIVLKTTAALIQLCSYIFSL